MKKDNQNLNKFTSDFIVSSKGQLDYPGMNTLIPNANGRITMKGVKQNVLGIDDLGNKKIMKPKGEYQFPGDSVYEIPLKKRGGEFKKGLVSNPKKTKKGLASKKYSRSLNATNILFTENFLFKKPKSRKNKVYNPKAKYYAEGGALLTKKVTCKKCGWKWDAEDGGNDITTCHKCGGQGLVHAQDGGESKCLNGQVWSKKDKRCIDLPIFGNSLNSEPFIKSTNLNNALDIKPLNSFSDFGKIKPKKIPVVKDSFLETLEKDINDFLDNPLKKAAQVSESLKEKGEDPSDALRHSIAGSLTAQTIANKTGNIPFISNPLGYLGANIAGIGHELSTLSQAYLDDRPWSVKLQESLEDIYNNSAGANTIFNNNSEKDKINYLLKLTRINQLPDGYGEERPFRDNPKWTDPYNQKQYGGITKLTPKEEKQFQNFYKTLPNNLQSDDDTYDIRGYWDSEQRPTEFDYTQPKDKDGFYHAYSINGNTGEYLKSPAHPTFQHAVNEDRKIGYRPITNVQGRNIVIENKSIADPEEQSFLRNTEGPINYIEADLNEDEIEEYRRGGYIVEEIDNYQDGGVYTVKGSKGAYKKVNGKWQVDWNKSGKYQPLSKGDVKARTAILDKMAKPVDDGMSKISSNSSDNTNLNLYQKEIPWELSTKYKGDILAQNKKNEEDAINYRAKNTISNQDFDKDNHISTEFPKNATASDYGQRIWEYATNPGTALEYAFGKKSGQGPMPFNINQLKEQGVNVNSDSNLVGNMFNMINPLDDVESIRSGVSDIYEGNNSGYLNAGLGLLGFLPGGDALKGSKNLIKKNIKTNYDFSPENLKEIAGFLPRRQFIKKLQEEELIGKNFQDLNYAARSTDKTNNLTQLALNREATKFRGVQGKVPIDGKGTQEYTGRNFDMSKPSWSNEISEFENMKNAGVNFDDPVSIAKYQATHIPMEKYGYTAGMGDFSHAAALYASDRPSGYGKYMFKMHSPRDYSIGNYQDWFNKYHNLESRKWDKLAVKDGYWDSQFMPNNPYDLPILLDRNTVVGKKGQKMFDIDETYPFTDYKNLGNKQIEYEEFLKKLGKDFDTGFRGQYQYGGENENPPDKVQDLNEVTVYGNQEKIKLQGSLIDRLTQYKKAYNDHRVNLGLEKQRQSAEGTSSIISLKDQIQSYKKELDEEKKSYDKASKALNVLKKYNPESYKKAKVSDVLNATGVDDLRNLYKEGKISDATFMDFYDNFGKLYDREATRTTEEDQLKLEDSWYGQPDEEGRTRWMGNPNNVAKVAQAVAIGAPLAAAAPIMAPAIGATLANPYVAGGLNAYFAGHGINEFNDPNSLTRKSMSRAYDDPTASNIGDAAFDVGMNSLNFVGLPFSKTFKGLKKYSKPLINSIDNTIYPTRTYSARLPGGNKTSYETSDLSKKIFKKGDWSTKSLDEARQYLSGSEATGRKGLLTGDDMIFTEYKVPFWKKNVSFDPDVVNLKNSQGVDINKGEFIIPHNKFLYPRKTTNIKAVPEHLKTAKTDLSIGDIEYSPSTIPLGPYSPQFASKPYKYIEDQINAASGHNMPLTYTYNSSLGHNQNIPLYNWKQPQFPINKRFKQGGTTNDYIELDLTPEEIQKYIDGGYIVEEIN